MRVRPGARRPGGPFRGRARRGRSFGGMMAAEAGTVIALRWVRSLVAGSSRTGPATGVAGRQRDQVQSSDLWFCIISAF